LQDLPAGIKEQAALILGLDPDSTSANICAYVDITGSITQEQGRSYDLTIDLDGNIITATTSIPVAVPLFDLKWEDPPGDPNDTMATLKVTIDDPGTEANFYRYFSSANGGPLVPPFASVVDDAFFDGKEFEFPLNQALERGAEVDPNTIGLWTRGDTIVLKWCTINVRPIPNTLKG